MRVKVSMGSGIRTATSASMLYAGAARQFAAQAASLDDVAVHHAAEEKRRGEIETELLNVSLAAVLTSYFAIEALLNEVFVAGSLGMAGNFKGLDTRAADQLSAAWDAGVSKLNPLEKADMALVVAGAAPLAWGQGAAQRFALLHDLRNDLVHHKPRWTEHGKPPTESDDKLERRLHQQFENAVIWKGRGAAFRWHGCLGAGCGNWAWKTAAGFAQELSGRLGVRTDWMAA